MTPAEGFADIDAARTATLRRVGRNLVNAQRIELLMKFLLGVTFSGPLAEFETRFKKHAEKVSRKTLGTLIPDLAETMSLPGDASVSTRAVNEVWLSSVVNVPMDAQSRDAWRQEWETIRSERNKLVHLMLGSVDFNSIEQCRKLDADLDAQNVLFLKGIAFLGPIVTATKEAIAEMASGEVIFDPSLPEKPGS
jgi:hypothetical protein